MRLFPPEKENTMSELAAEPASRDPAGRFLPGQSGNPAGKAPGTRNRATLLREIMEDDEDRVIGRVVIDKAKAGDAVAARFVVAHLWPRPRARAVAITLADGLPAHNVVAAHDAVLRALFAGEIAPDEAEAVTRVLDARMRAIKTWKEEDILTRHRPSYPTMPLRAAAPPRPPPRAPAFPLQAQVTARPSRPRRAPSRTARQARPIARPPADRLHSACIRQGSAVLAPEREETAQALLAALTGSAPRRLPMPPAGREDSA